MKRGFTLIELLIVISIMVLVFGITIAAFSTFTRRQRLEQAALNLKTALRFAQTRAISADKPISGCTQFVGIYIEFTLDSYTIKHVCTDGFVGTEEVTTLPSGITFYSVPSPFTFQALTHVIDKLSDQTITMVNTSGQTYQLQVTITGQINDIGIH